MEHNLSSQICTLPWPSSPSHLWSFHVLRKMLLQSRDRHCQQQGQSQRCLKQCHELQPFHCESAARAASVILPHRRWRRLQAVLNLQVATHTNVAKTRRLASELTAMMHCPPCAWALWCQFVKKESNGTDSKFLHDLWPLTFLPENCVVSYTCNRECFEI